MSLSKVVGALAAVLAAVGAIVAAQDALPGFRTLISDIGPPGIDTGVRDADPPREPRPRDDRVSRSSSLPYLRGSIIVKVQGRRRGGVAARDARTRRCVDDDGRAVLFRFQHRHDRRERRSGSCGARAGRATRRRVRAGALPHAPDVRAQRSAVLDAVELPRHRHGARVGPEPGRELLDHRRRARYRRRLQERPSCAFNAPAWTTAGRRRRFRRSGTVDVPFAAAPDLGGSDRFVSPRDFIWNDTDPLDLDGHGTHVSGTIGQLTNNGVGVAGMAFNVRIMPVKVLDFAVGRHLRQPVRRRPTTSWRAASAMRWTTAPRC